MTYSEIGKLKYAVSAELQDDVTLPKIPVESDKSDDELGLRLADFLCTILKVCLGERVGMARALALEIIFSLDTFQQLLRDCELVREEERRIQAQMPPGTAAFPRYSSSVPGCLAVSAPSCASED